MKEKKQKKWKNRDLRVERLIGTKTEKKNIVKLNGSSKTVHIHSSGGELNGK